MNEQANIIIRLTVRHGGHAGMWLAGGRMIHYHPRHALLGEQKGPATVPQIRDWNRLTHLLCISNGVGKMRSHDGSACGWVVYCCL